MMDWTLQKLTNLGPSLTEVIIFVFERIGYDLTVNDSNSFSSIMIYSTRELKEEKIWLLSPTFSQFFVVSVANFWWKLLSVNLGKMKCNNY